MKKNFKIILFVLLFLIIAIGIIFGVYVSNYYKASNVDEYMTSNDTVEVLNNDDYIAFLNKESKTYDYGYIFYPGAKVEASAYSPLMYKLAQDGVFTAIVKMPFHIALFNIDGANKVYSKYDDVVENFYIGGHSLGGAMASTYLAKNKSKYEGLILLASYSTKDLSASILKTLSIYGTNDEVLNKEAYEKNKKNLPNLTEYIIDGANHAGFASYNNQKGDGKLLIDNQIDLTKNSILDFLY